MRYLLHILLFTPLFFTAQTTQQLYTKHFVKQNKVLFRLLPSDRKFFDLLRSNGLKITRYTSLNGVLSEETIIEKSLKAYWQADTLNWMKLIRKDKDKAAFVHSAIFNSAADPKLPPAEKQKKEKMLFDLLALSCDFDADIARACGLFFCDSTTQMHKTYVYQISLYTSPEQAKETTKITVNTSVLSENKAITGLELKKRKSICTLKWNAENYAGIYSGYYVERSTDSFSFHAITSSPVILLKTQFDKHKKHIFFNDTLKQPGKKYFYRLKGINLFGESSDPSAIVSVFHAPVFYSGPVITDLKIKNNQAVSVKWQMEDSSENRFPKTYVLMKSANIRGPYSCMLQSSAQQFYTDTSSVSAYYKVGAVSFDNDTTFSFARLAVIIDTIPPPAPDTLIAQSDKKGKVIIRWSRSKENILGYKLFKSNTRNGEFVQINNRFITDTFYTEQLNLKTLSKTIYYCVASSDPNYNTSVRSKIIEVLRPDTIAPAAPILNSAVPGINGVTLRFILSASDDVKHHVLMARRFPDPDYKTIQIIGSDTVSRIIDSSALQGEKYVYMLKAVDLSGNSSLSNSITVQNETGFRKKIETVSYSVDRQHKNILLEWSYPEKDIEKIIVYRAKENGLLSIVKTLNGNTNSYTDRELNIGNVYIYRLKAVFFNGAESIISNEIKVTY